MTNYALGDDYNFSMDIIYIDWLFFLNLASDYLIVLCSARLCGIKLRRLTYALSAVFGALYAVLSILPELEFITTAPVKLICGALMALIAYGGEEKLLRCCLVFFAVSALFGGAFMVLADLVSRTILAPQELPVGAVTALIGAPFFAYIYFHRERS